MSRIASGVSGPVKPLRHESDTTGAAICAVSADATTLLGTTNGATLMVNGVSVPVQNGRFETAVSLNQGKNTIQLKATNEGGSTEAAITVTRATPPTEPASTAPKPAPKPSTKPTTPTTSPTPTAPAPSTPTVSFVADEVKLSAVLGTSGATLSWTRATKSFKGYAIVKSTTNSSPYYPKLWQSAFLSDVDSRQWVDTNVEKGKTTYYRVCAVALDDTVRCGNVASVTKP
jgi:hypothetical protein